MNQKQFDQIIDKVERLQEQGQTYLYKSQLDPVHESFQQALTLLQPLIQEHSDKLPSLFWQLVATLTGNIGVIHLHHGSLDEALIYLQKALEIFNENSDNPLGIAGVLNNIGTVYEAQDNFDEALNYFHKALVINRSHSDNSPEIATRLNNISTIYQKQGKNNEALDYLQQSLAILNDNYRNLKLPISNSGVKRRPKRLTNPTIISGQQQNILQNQDSIALISIATTLNNIGNVYLSQNNLDTALDYFQQSLVKLNANFSDSIQAATAMNNIGGVYRDQGKLDEALDFYQKALVISRAISLSSPETAACISNIGFIYQNQGRLDEAYDHYQQALVIDNVISPNSTRTATRFNLLGSVCQAQGKLDEALSHYANAMKVVELLRRTAGGSGAAEAIQGEFVDAYAGSIDILCQQGGTQNTAHAFGIAESYRARGLTDRLGANATAPTPESEADQALLKKQFELKIAYSRVLDETSQIRANLAHPQFPAERRLEYTQALDDRNDTRLKIEQAQDANDRAIRERFPEFAALSSPQPLSLAGVQSAVLDTGTLLLSYLFVGNDLLIRWVVRKDGVHFDKRTLPGIFYDDLRAVIAPLHAGGTGDSAAAGRLAEILLGGIPGTLLDGATRGIVLPDSNLFLLPFEMLPWNGGVFGDAFPLTYAPSATFLDALRKLWDTRPAPPTSDKPFIGFGDPDSDGPIAERRAGAGALPGANEETQNIARTMGGVARIGPEATEKAVFEEVSGKRFVHFATHGFYHDKDPLLSGLHLAKPAPGDTKHDGILTVAEMFSLPLNAELVACSACVSGLGKTDAGRGIEGMSTALLLAGAKTVLVTLWPVSDTSMQLFMQTFYSKRKENPDLSTSQVLQATHQFVRNYWSKPFHWAPVVAFGLE
jgi:tetratricopeptide (TPR) repeat protein